MFLTWLHWHFIEVPRSLLKVWKNFLYFNFNYFLVPQLFKTFFSHWRNIQEYYPRGFNPKRYLEICLNNLISRVLGAIIRSITIIIALIFELLILIIGFFIFSLWLFLPLLILTLFFLGTGIIIF